MVSVTFWVAVDGRVERVAVSPEFRDNGYSRRFEEVMKSYRFRPARSAEGQAVPGTVTMTMYF